MRAIGLKLSLLFMFMTGLALWDIVGIPWEQWRSVQAIHILGSLFVSLFLVIPFVNAHTYEHVVVHKIRSMDGWLLGVILLAITLSGFYLFWIGNRGGDSVGKISFILHLYGSFALLFLLFYHIKKATIKPIVPMLVLMLTFYPLSLKANETQLTLLKTGDATRYHNQDWTNSTKCKSCHSAIFDQWADSNHKNSVESNPYYMVMEALAGEDQGEGFRQWCMGCHNPSALTTGQAKTGHAMEGNFLSNALFEKGAKTLQNDFKTHGNSRLEEGISCVACHVITKATSQGNGSYTLKLAKRPHYVFENSRSSMGQYLGEKFINANPSVHKKSYSNKLYKQSTYCASCHDEFSPLTGKKIVSTFQEWEKSPYNNPKNPQKHKECIDCHMTYLKDGKFAPLAGVSTNGGTHKKDIKVHYFSGSNHFLSGLKNPTHKDQTIQLLKTSAKLDVKVKNNTIIVGVTNIGAGHHLPTGVADFRQLWLEVTLKDKTGKLLFQSGKLKKDGNLGEDARSFMKVFGDKDGKPVGLLFWKYQKLLRDTRIPAGERREESYTFDDTQTLSYPLSVTIKLNFRVYPQWVTKAVQKAYPQLPNPPVIELNEVRAII